MVKWLGLGIWPSFIYGGLNRGRVYCAKSRAPSHDCLNMPFHELGR